MGFGPTESRRPEKCLRGGRAWSDPSSMTQRLDRRHWSTTARGLSAIVGELQRRGMPATSVRVVQQIMGRQGIYPARDFAEHVTAEPPDVFFTYHSAHHLLEIPGAVWRALDVAADQLRRRLPELQWADFEDFVGDEIRLWIDFVFIDQSARDLRAELDVLPRLLDKAAAHFVMGYRPLTRAWCAYEIALFNRRAADGDPSPLRSLVDRTLSPYRGWEHTETSEPGDKRFMEERIHGAFPGAFDGFNRVMQRVNDSVALQTVEGESSYEPSALEALGVAAEAWHRRQRGGGSVLRARF